MAKLPVPMPPPGEMLRRRRLEQRYWAFLRRLCLVTAALCILFSQVLLLHRHQGLGMYPAVQSGDLVLATRLGKAYEKEDLVLYRLEGQVRLGRIVAIAGDEVRMGSSGQLLVNGSVQNGPILYPTYARENGMYSLRVPEAAVYILGDHRTQSTDSRDHGCVREEDILGTVMGILRTGNW